MKRNILSLFLIILCACAYAWNSPVPIPDLENARLHIVCQNAANYVSNLEASNSSCSTQAEFETKTLKIANAFIALDADIVGICEVQADDEILGYIVNKMNELSGGNDYSYITDGIYDVSSGGNYQPLKSGFIYRPAKVVPVGNNTSPYYSGEYYRRLRLQAFKEVLTEEKFVLSMNHFKAKSGAGQGESTRIQNANELIETLGYITIDPDILIIGDLNAYMDETPIANLESAGFEEQLVVYDPDAYTYIYQGDPGILDHCMANATMAAQITGAYAYHINTAGGYNYRYSDHDAVVAGINLGEDVPSDREACETPDATAPARKVLRNGQLLIETGGKVFTVTGLLIER